MIKTLPAIALFAGFLSWSLPAAAQYSLDDRLIQAVERDDTAAIQPLLDKGANINDARDYMGATPLVLAVELGKADMVDLLLAKGANLEAKGDFGKTALLAAVCPQYVPGRFALTAEQKVKFAKLLLDKGASIEAKDSSYISAVDCANHWGPAELVDLLQQVGRQRKLLEQAQSKEPGERLSIYASALQANPQDAALREQIIQLAVTLPSPPAVPEAAQQLFVLASNQIKQANTPAALDQPIALLRKALALAPWWGNAYYNLSRALEMHGQYDDAIRQLNHYLELKPAEAGAREARAHIVVLQTERDAAAHRQP